MRIILSIALVIAVAIFAGDSNDFTTNRSWWDGFTAWFSGGYTVDDPQSLAAHVIQTADSNYTLYGVPSGYNVVDATLLIASDTTIATEYYVAIHDSAVTSANWFAFEANLDSMESDVMRIPVIGDSDSLVVRATEKNVAFYLSGTLVRHDVALSLVNQVDTDTSLTVVHAPASGYSSQLSFHYANLDTSTDASAIIEFKTKITIGDTAYTQLVYSGSVPANGWTDIKWGESNFQTISLDYGDTVWVRSSTGDVVLQAYSNDQR